MSKQRFNYRQNASSTSSLKRAASSTFSDSNSRTIIKKLTAKSQTEGAGFVVHRPIAPGYGRNEAISQLEADPFLMLDELGPTVYTDQNGSNPFDGAPWHPHRGFDTVMYFKEGEGKHEDSMGNSGILRGGDVQWMTAASGLVHQEGKDHPGGPMHGFQMWVNLPRENKMDPPGYKDIAAKAIPTYMENNGYENGGITAKVIAGSVGINENIVQARVQPKARVQYVDFMLGPNQMFTHVVPDNMDTLMVYVYHGSGEFGNEVRNGTRNNGPSNTLTVRNVGLFSTTGNFLNIKSSPNGVKFLLMAGEKLNEPIVQHGPFVMNSQEEIQECFRDWQNSDDMGMPRKKSVIGFVRHQGAYERIDEEYEVVDRPAGSGYAGGGGRASGGGYHATRG